MQQVISVPSCWCNDILSCHQRNLVIAAALAAPATAVTAASHVQCRHEAFYHCRCSITPVAVAEVFQLLLGSCVRGAGSTVSVWTSRVRPWCRASCSAGTCNFRKRAFHGIHF